MYATVVFMRHALQCSYWSAPFGTEAAAQHHFRAILVLQQPGAVVHDTPTHLPVELNQYHLLLL